MPRLLGLDWDHNQLHLVSGTTSRSGVKIDRALVLSEDATLDLKNAEAMGLKLKQVLKEAKLAPAPLIACVGRDRFVWKEIRHPPVPKSEEATLVKFQAQKELTESPDSLVLDYCPLGEATKTGERKAAVFAIRKEVPAVFQTICRVAGVKLAAVTPRAFGMAAAVRNESANATVAVVVLAERWAGICLVHDGKLLMGRQLTQGPGLIGEIKRNLAVFTGQAGGSNNLKALFIAGAEDHGDLRERMQETLGLPVLPLNPFARQDTSLDLPGSRGGFTGIIGLMESWGRDKGVPINFVKPREAVPEVNPHRNRNIFLAAACVLLAIGGFVAARLYVDSQKERLDGLNAEAAYLDTKIAGLSTDSKVFEELKKWNQTVVPWLDELYDLAAHHDLRDDHVVLKWTGNANKKVGAPAAGKGKTGPEQYVAQVVLLGEVGNSKSAIHSVDLLKERVLKDGKHWVVSTEGLKFDENKSSAEYTMKVDVAKQPSDKYATLFTPAEAKKVPQFKTATAGGGKGGGMGIGGKTAKGGTPLDTNLELLPLAVIVEPLPKAIIPDEANDMGGLR